MPSNGTECEWVNPFIFLTRFVWIYENFENNFGLKHRFVKYLKEICAYSFAQHFSFKYLLENAFITVI